MKKFSRGSSAKIRFFPTPRVRLWRKRWVAVWDARWTVFRKKNSCLNWRPPPPEKRSTLSCQRSDEEGKALVVSLYLHDFLKKSGLKLDPLPRAWPERVKKAEPTTLTPKEVSIAYHRENEEPEALYKGLGWNRSLLTHLIESQNEIEAFGSLGIHDGLIGEDPLAKAILEKGLSPQTLKDLAECPFKVYSRKVLQLYTEQGDVEEGQLTHTGRGKLIHNLLQSFYQRGLASNDLDKLIDDEFKTIGAVYSDVYPLALQAEKTRILAMLQRFIPLDQADQKATGFKPAYFETALAQEINGIKLHGRVDRLDTGKDGFRVVDYKKQLSRGQKGTNLGHSHHERRKFSAPGVSRYGQENLARKPKRSCCQERRSGVL